MLIAIAIVASIIAVGAWIVAVTSALSIVALAPAGKRLSAWFAIGWWQFDKILTVTGPAAEPHIKRYTWAFMAFFLAIFLGFFLAVAVGIATQDKTPAEGQLARPAGFNDPRVIAVRTADATLPDARSFSLALA